MNDKELLREMCDFLVNESMFDVILDKNNLIIGLRCAECGVAAGKGHTPKCKADRLYKKAQDWLNKESEENANN